MNPLSSCLDKPQAAHDWWRSFTDTLARDASGLRGITFVFGIRCKPVDDAAIDPGPAPKSYTGAKAADWVNQKRAAIAESIPETMFLGDIGEVILRPASDCVSENRPALIIADPLCVSLAVPKLLNRGCAIIGVNAGARLRVLAAYVLKAHQFLADFPLWRQPTFGWGVAPLVADPLALLMGSSASDAEIAAMKVALGVFKPGQSLADEVADVADIVHTTNIANYVNDWAAR